MAKRDTTFQVKKELTGVVARGLNNFYVPEEREVVSPEAKELVNSLSAIVPTLRQYDNTKYEIKKTEEEIKGALAFKENNELDFKKAVEQKLIPAGANPYFIIAYNESELENKGNIFQNNLKTKYANMKGDLTRNTNPNAVNDFINAELQLFMEENNIDGYDEKLIVNNFLPKVDAIENELNNNIANSRVALIEENQKINFSSNIQSYIENAYNELDDDNIESIIGQKINNQILKFSKFTNINSLNKLAVESIISYAESELNTGILDIVKNIKTQNGKNLSDIPEYLDLIEKSKDAIISDKKSNLAFMQSQEEYNRKQNRKKHLESFQVYYDEYRTENLKNNKFLMPSDVTKYIKDNDITDVITINAIKDNFNINNEFLNNAKDVDSIVDGINQMILEDASDITIDKFIEEQATSGNITGTTAMNLMDIRKQREELLENPLLSLELIKDNKELIKRGILQEKQLADTLTAPIIESMNQEYERLTEEALEELIDEKGKEWNEMTLTTKKKLYKVKLGEIFDEVYDAYVNRGAGGTVTNKEELPIIENKLRQSREYKNLQDNIDDKKNKINKIQLKIDALSKNTGKGKKSLNTDEINNLKNELLDLIQTQKNLINQQADLILMNKGEQEN